MSLVPLASLGNMLGIRVRGMASIIRQACIIRERDYWAIGRSVESLGLSRLRSKSLLSLAMDGDFVQARSANTPTWTRALVN